MMMMMMMMMMPIVYGNFCYVHVDATFNRWLCLSVVCLVCLVFFVGVLVHVDMSVTPIELELERIWHDVISHAYHPSSMYDVFK